MQRPLSSPFHHSIYFSLLAHNFMQKDNLNPIFLFPLNAILNTFNSLYSSSLLLTSILTMKAIATKILSLSLISPVIFYTYTKCANSTQTQASTNSISFKNRQQHLKQVEADPNYDLVVIGGGCNGAGVVLDASTRGLRTLLIEKHDFAAGTSSKSTKLIHGGVRYLEQVFAFDTSSISSRIEKFGLVKQAITERGVMIRSASYMNDKISFVIPCTNSFWSAYYYLGSVVYYLIYWLYSPKNTVKFNFPYFLHRNELREYFPFMDDKYQSGVVYEDGSFNDSRMVLMSLLTTTLSKDQHRFLPISHCPSNILNKAEFIDFIKNEEGKITGVKFKQVLSGKIYEVKTKYAVNCTGTWADQIRLKDDPQVSKRMCLVGGSHITYDAKVGSSRMGICLPSKDGRILLIVPWLKRIIAGTTQKTFEQPQLNPVPSKQERQFIQQQMGEVMGKLSSSSLINLEISKWSGLRPLVMNQESKNTKDIARTHVVEKSKSGLLSLMGGKWTTYRKMGEDLVNQIAKEEEKKGNKIGPSCSSDVLLAGSCPEKLKEELFRKNGIRGEYLYKTYGSMSHQILEGEKQIALDVISVGELKHIIKNQMVNDVQDVLLRRLRIAFLYNKDALFSLVPLVTRLILEEKKQKYSKQQLKKLIQENIQRINGYQFS